MSLITWSSSDKASNYVLSNQGLTANLNSDNIYQLIRATEGKTSGKWYFEVKVDISTNVAQTIGVCASSTPYLNSTSLSSIPSSAKVYHRGGYIHYPQTSGRPTYTVGDIIGVGLDMNEGVVNFYKNGVFIANITNILSVSNEFFPCLISFHTLTNTANFGSTPFNMVTTYPTTWEQLTTSGYLPYDFVSANENWFSVNKHLIMASNKIYSVIGNTWIDVTASISDITNISQPEFETFGMDTLDNVNVNFLNQEAEFKVITYTTKKTSLPKLELTVPEYRLIDQLARPLSILTFTDTGVVPILKQEYNYPYVGTRILKRG